MDLNKTDPQPLTAKDLSRAHLGKTITLRSGLGEMTGILAGVDHWADVVSVATFSEPSQEALGRAHTTITLLGWGASGVSPDTRVEVRP